MFDGLDSLFGKRDAGSCPANAGGSSKLSDAEKKGYVKAHNDLRKKEGANLPDVVRILKAIKAFISLRLIYLYCSEVLCVVAYIPNWKMGGG